MAYYDTKQPAVDPDNPTATEQVTNSEWNQMVLDFRRKLYEKAVDISAIGDNKILVYDLASDSFVFEAQSAVGAINDLSDVVISGVPADNEVLAYDSGTSDWINQNAHEAGLATTTDLITYLPLTGGTLAGALTTTQVNMGGSLVMNDYYITGVSIVTPTGSTITLDGIVDVDTHQIINVVDPTSAQDAATKNYADTRLFTKEAVTSFLDGYVPVYRTSSGKFEMEEVGGGSAGFPVVDTTDIIKGSVDGTKLMRFEADGLTTGTTRVMTIPDKNITLCDTAEVMLLSGTQAMAGALNMGMHEIKAVHEIIAGAAAGVTFYDSNLSLCAVLASAYSGTNDFYTDVDMQSNDITAIGALVLDVATECTISSGVITVSNSYHSVDTEASAATDDLDTINGGSEGYILVLSAEDSARTVVCKDGTGNLHLVGDFSMDIITDTITLISTGTYWLELSRSNNA